MSFFTVLFALILEQVKPLPRDNWVHAVLAHWAAWACRNLDAGEQRHARIVWSVAVLVPGLLVALLHWLLLEYVSILLALAMDVAIIYLTLGFRQFSHYFTDIREALERGDEAQARRLLAQWRQVDVSDLPRTELLRHVIEYSLLAAHRHVFGVFFSYVVLAVLGLGPAGAVIYRMAEFVSREWQAGGHSDARPVMPAQETVSQPLMLLADRAFAWLDYIPARLTASGFAVVGNFEEAVAGWQRDAALWKRSNEGVILASAAGAVGVQLGGAAVSGLAADLARVVPGSAAESRGSEGSSSTPGMPAQLGHLGSVVGLVWRSVVLWMLLLALLKLANLLG